MCEYGISGSDVIPHEDFKISVECGVEHNFSVKADAIYGNFPHGFSRKHQEAPDIWVKINILCTPPG